MFLRQELNYWCEQYQIVLKNYDKALKEYKFFESLQTKYRNGQLNLNPLWYDEEWRGDVSASRNVDRARNELKKCEQELRKSQEKLETLKKQLSVKIPKSSHHIVNHRLSAAGHDEKAISLAHPADAKKLPIKNDLPKQMQKPKQEIQLKSASEREAAAQYVSIDGTPPGGPRLIP
jgi:hypothetical protein